MAYAASSGVVIATCCLAIACGSRTGIEACVSGACAGEATGPRGTSQGGGGATGQGGGGTTSQGGSDAGAESEGGASGAPAETPPIVLLVIDGSFSMFQSSVWTPMYDALMGPDGPIERYDERVRFGFASYRGPGQTSEDDFACAEVTYVQAALENSARIRETYGALETRRGYYETPTAHALTRVAGALGTAPPDARKYLFLFSDGAPDTCFTTQPQCGQDRAVFAVQAALRAGIQTRAIGVGFGTEYNCDHEASRCGADHFQDLANAGRGLPVQAPPAAYTSLPCVAETGGALLAEYAEQGGQAPFSWALSPDEVKSAVESMLEEIALR
jgi:hypothetical protein